MVRLATVRHESPKQTAALEGVAAIVVVVVDGVDGVVVDAAAMGAAGGGEVELGREPLEGGGEVAELLLLFELLLLLLPFLFPLL